MKQLFSIKAKVFILAQKQCLTIWLLMLLSLSALIVGCGAGQGSSSKSSTLPNPVQACELLTKAEVETLIGASVDEPQETHREEEEFNHWMSICNYYSPEKNFSLGVTLMPHGRDVTGAEAFALYEAELKETLGDDYKMEVVAGVGDYGGWESSVKQLTIFQGPFMILVGIVNPELEGTAALEFNKQVAAKVLTKLPQ
ncbi:MAG: hypothetical protein JW953_04870 [Anaerolineae bacterium]|nr:hypothetical protein [Anaerolineae bacterium]